MLDAPGQARSAPTRDSRIELLLHASPWLIRQIFDRSEAGLAPRYWGEPLPFLRGKLSLGEYLLARHALGLYRETGPIYEAISRLDEANRLALASAIYGKRLRPVA